MRPYVLAATILASAMAFIDSTIVTIALPAIQRDLHISFSTLQWVMNAYSLTLGTLLLVGGSAGDLYGRRLVFATGTVIFTLASVACAMAYSPAGLIAARLVQGAGAALMIPQSLSIIAASFPRETRSEAIGYWASASAITTALGPAIGGFLIDYWSWRAAFWINVPLAMLTLLLTLRYVPESKSEAASNALDWTGGLLAIAGFGFLTLGMTNAAENAQSLYSVALPFAAGVLCVALFIAAERQAINPILPLSLFRGKVFTSLNLITLLLYGSFGAALFLLPFDLIEARGYPASEVGVALLIVGFVIAAFSNLGARWDVASGPRPPLICGSLLVTAANLLLMMHNSSLVLGVLTPLFFMSAGMAIAVTPLTASVLNVAPDSQSGAASGVNNAASRLAVLFAVAIAGSVTTIVFRSFLTAAGAPENLPRFGALPDSSSPARALIEHAFLNAYAAGMLAAASFGALAALTAILTPELSNLPHRAAKPLHTLP